jgi:hypothetical protein
VFESRVLKRIFGPEREEVAGGWRRLHNEELHNCMNAVPNIISMIKSRRMGNAELEVRMGEIGNAYKIFVEKP